MNFDELFQKAEKNARRQERKVRKFDQELEKKRRLQNERIAIERARAKLELNRKMPPPAPASLPKSKKETQNFVIPKKKVKNPVQKDNSSISAKKQQNQTIVNKQNHLQRIQEDKKGFHVNNKIGRVEKQQTSQNQISKKQSIQRKPNSTGIQQQRPVVQNYEELLKQAAENDVSAVEQLFNDVDSTKGIPTKKPRIGEEEIGITAGLRLTYSAAREKEKKLMAMAAENRAKEIIQQQRSKNVANGPNSAKNISSSLIPSRHISQKNPPQISKYPISNNQSAQKRPIENQRNSQNIMTKNKVIKKLNGSAILDENLIKSKLKSPFPSKNKEIDESPLTKINKIAKNKPQKPTYSINSSLPQKRYLPGDIRYKPEQQTSLSTTTEMMKKSSISSSEPKNGPNMNEKLKTNSAMVISKTGIQSGQMKQEKMKNLQILTEKKKQPIEMKRKEEMRNLVPKQRNVIQPKARRMSPTKVRTKMERTRPQESGYNLEKIKKETYDRLQMLKQRENRPYKQLSRPTNGNIGSRKFANYSETDEEEEEKEYRDEDDSDLADFIDDSMVDDLQREDLEETLRIINPRYNKKKWLERERLIDERRMDARFKDVELEERKSAKMGLVEDLIEAKRGSKALS